VRTEIIAGEYDSYVMETRTYDSWCDYETEPDCEAYVEDRMTDFFGREIVEQG
jgi:hypothetical protein